MPRPTLLIHTSIRPAAAIASSTTRSTSERRVMSAGIVRARPAHRFATATSASRRRATSTTRSPLAAASTATAAPMPELAPVDHDHASLIRRWDLVRGRPAGPRLVRSGILQHPPVSGGGTVDYPRAPTSENCGAPSSASLHGRLERLRGVRARRRTRCRQTGARPIAPPPSFGARIIAPIHGPKGVRVRSIDSAGRRPAWLPRARPSRQRSTRTARRLLRAGAAAARSCRTSRSAPSAA